MFYDIIMSLFMPHEGVVMVVFPTTLLVYHSDIYPQGMTFKYGLGGRLASAGMVQ